MRLDKFLSDTGALTRSQARESIRRGLVTVNSLTVKAPEQHIDPEKDSIALKGERLSYRRFLYYMLNKPAGVVCATKDSREKTVLELLPKQLPGDLFPAGRLDKDTEGLLLITNDGELAHSLLSPKRHVDKTYLVGTKYPFESAQAAALMQGVDIGDTKPTKPAKVCITGEKELLLTIQEGRFHQVKRMLLAVNNEVLSLKRTAFGSLRLDEGLEPGHWRELTEKEIEALYEDGRGNGRKQKLSPSQDAGR